MRVVHNDQRKHCRRMRNEGIVGIYSMTSMMAINITALPFQCEFTITDPGGTGTGNRNGRSTKKVLNKTPMNQWKGMIWNGDNWICTRLTERKCTTFIKQTMRKYGIGTINVNMRKGTRIRPKEASRKVTIRIVPNGNKGYWREWAWWFEMTH